MTTRIEERHRARVFLYMLHGPKSGAMASPYIKLWVDTGEADPYCGFFGREWYGELDRLAQAFAELEAEVRTPYEAEKAEQLAMYEAWDKAMTEASAQQEARLKAAHDRDADNWEFSD